MLRDGTTGDWIGTFMGHKGATWSAKLSKDASLAVTGSADFSAKVWDTYKGTAMHTYAHNHIVRSVDFNAAATQILTGGQEKKVRVFDLRSEDAVCELAGHTGNIRSVVWDKRKEAGGHIVLSAGDDKIVRFWDLRAQKEVATWQAKDQAAITSLEMAEGYITSTAGKNVYFLDPNTHETAKCVETAYDVSAVSLNPQRTRFVTGGSSELWVRVYDFASGEELEVYKGHHGPIHTVSYSPDGGLYATGSEDGTVRLWKAVDGPYGLWN